METLSKYIKIVGILLLACVILGFVCELFDVFDGLSKAMVYARQTVLFLFWGVLLYFNQSRTKLFWIILGGAIASILPLLGSVFGVSLLTSIWIGLLLGVVCLLLSNYFQGTLKTLLIVFFALKIVQTIAYFSCNNNAIPYLAYVIIYYLVWFSIAFFCVLYPQYPEESGSFVLALEMDNKEKKGIKKEYVTMLIVAVAIIVIAVVIGLYANSKSYESSAYSSSGRSYQNNTTETVYKGSQGTTVVLCDDGVAYINGKKGNWLQSYVRLGSDSYEFIKIRQNGMVSEGGIFRGKFYYGRSSERAIQEDYPDGEPLTSSRR